MVLFNAFMFFSKPFYVSLILVRVVSALNNSAKANLFQHKLPRL